MSVLSNINQDLTNFIYSFVGEEKVHDLGGEFLGVPYHSDNPFFEAVERVVHDSDLFLAWLWSDYLYKKRSFLQHFYDQSKSLAGNDKIALGQLLASQQFSLFRFGEIRPGNIECIDLRTGVHYHVREYSMASQIRTGQVSLLRVCQQGDHWEIIMPNGCIHPLTIEDNEFLKQLTTSLPPKITFKNTSGYYQLLQDIGIDPKPEPEPARLTTAESSRQLSAALKATGVANYISLQRVQKLLEDEYKAKATPLSPPIGIRIVMGLTKVDSLDDCMIVMRAAQNYWNSLIPDKVIRKRAKSRAPSDMAVGIFSHTKWIEYAELAHDCLIVRDAELAVELYEELFEVMKADYSVTPSLYRLIANASTAYLIYGDLVLGKHLLDIAQRLCPSYDFAQKQRKLLDSGYYGVIENSLSIPLDNPIINYMAWFDSLGINMTMGDGQTTKLTSRPGPKIGRNEPCICGALRENGLPVKYKNCHGQV